MRGKRCAGLRLLLLPAIFLAAGSAAAQTPTAPEPALPAAIIVLDASSSMSAKVGGTAKIDALKTELGTALGVYAGRVAFGLVAFGHRKASNCADSEILAKPGELTFAAKDKLLDKIKPKGQSPVAAALSDAANAAQAQAKPDIVLIADGGDNCDADVCSTAVAMKEKSPSLRIHVIGFGGKPDEIKPLACIAASTGGTFVAAANAGELKQGLAGVLDAVAAPAAPVEQVVATAAAPAAADPPAALPLGTAAALPIDLDAQAEAEASTSLPPGTVATTPMQLETKPDEPVAQAQDVAPAPGETAVNKSAGEPVEPEAEAESGEAASDAPPVQRVQSVPIAPPPPPTLPTPEPTAEVAVAPPPAPAPPEQAPAAAAAAPSPPPSAPPPAPAQQLAAAPPAAPPPAQVQRPVPVTFKALISEQGPNLQSGLTWRVYAAKASPEGGGFKLLSTHREANPTAALLPGEYLVNAAYGLSNLTKKIKVESGRSLEETFVLNTGALKLAALLPSGEKLADGAVKFDILSDEEDQFGNRHKILGNARPGVVIRLNAGAYRIESLYGDANAIVKADVTVEPGKVTEATIKQTGAKTTLKLVQSLGGEALADTKWTILTSAGDVVKENAGALPTHILAPGSYAVVADHGGLSYTRKFSIETGEAKQVEVVVDDGPTSPEDLKALTDPPEVPEPPSGMIAGDGQAPSPGAGTAFDGFSATSPADPNAPLINPGVLLRGAR
jgi:hypothetical protein